MSSDSLTNLQVYLEALRDGVIDADPATFESLLEESERLVPSSRSLDTLAAGDAGSGVPATTDLDLARLIRSAVDLARPGIVSGGLELGVDVPTDLPARGDPDQLSQALSNLLQNAVRYTPPGGRIDVTAERRPGDVLVSVTNSGDGIPSQDLPHVFERFYRVEKSRDRGRGGAGIGLAIVRQLVEAAGGSVGAESRDGRTTFWFSLPADPWAISAEGEAVRLDARIEELDLEEAVGVRLSLGGSADKALVRDRSAAVRVDIVPWSSRGSDPSRNTRNGIDAPAGPAPSRG